MTVAPNGDVTVPEIVRLHVMLSVADGPVRVLMPDINLSMTRLPAGGSSFVLHPDPAPADKYDISMTVQAFDSDGNLIAIGSESMQAVSKGCNRLTVHLAGLPVNQSVDMAIPPGGPIDMAGVLPPDLAGCIGGTPDEDSDGRANFCDLCPDDSDPTPSDTDGDGLPDACDPDTGTKTNTALYFDPFDNPSGHWSTSNTLIGMSFLTLDTQGQNVLSSNNGVDTLPTNVRVQAHIFLKAIYTGTPLSDTGVYVGNNANPAAATAEGVLCTLHYHAGSGPDTLDIYPVHNGTLGAPTATNMQFVSAMYRMRVTQRSTGWTCETTANGLNPATVTLTKAVPGPLFMSLRAENMESHFHAVVAESALP
ncbi:MAG: hypothetical protein ACXVCV_07715 [Polyangia bacterium]